MLKSPFPWFGGKLPIADKVWNAIGDVPNYVEPFFGSGAVFLNRPTPHKTSTINDKDGYVCNFWRAIQSDPEAVAGIADYPVIENDLHARHAWLLSRKSDLVARLEGDPTYYDVRIAAWWCWGLCCWIGSGWCAGGGPWRIVGEELIKSNGENKWINRKRPNIASGGKGVFSQHGGLTSWFNLLANKFRKTRICCGDWDRICGPSPTFKIGLTGVFLDPPYSHSMRDSGLYAVETDCSRDVLEWCKENGNNPLLRIVLAGYEGEHNELESLGWKVESWKAGGGYARQSKKKENTNRNLERLWFSPHCLNAGKAIRLDFAG